MSGTAPAAVLITGGFGVGKSSVAIELVDVLSDQGLPCALLDLDYLDWFDLGSGVHRSDILLGNLTCVYSNYREAGVRFFVLAGFLADSSQLEGLKKSLEILLRVVRLAAPWPEIERRLAADVNTSRQDDLREARTSEHRGAGVGLEDLSVDNDRPIREVAMEVCENLGWLQESAS